MRAPEVEVLRDAREAQIQPRRGGAQNRIDELVGGEPRRRAERQTPVDEDEPCHELGMPRGEGDRDERSHRVRDDDDRTQVERGRDGGQIGRMRGHSGGSRDLIAASPATEVRRDDPHPGEGFGEELPREVRRGHAVDREDRRRGRVLGIPHADGEVAPRDRNSHPVARARHRAVQPPSIV